MKVLPQYLDLKGRNSVAPSLYERDAYQVYLRDHPDKRSGMRFFVQWKAKGPAAEPLKLRVELRGTAEGNLLQTPAPMRLLSQMGDTPGGLAQGLLRGLAGEALAHPGLPASGAARLRPRDRAGSDRHRMLALFGGEHVWRPGTDHAGQDLASVDEHILGKEHADVITADFVKTDQMVIDGRDDETNFVHVALE